MTSTVCVFLCVFVSVFLQRFAADAARLVAADAETAWRALAARHNASDAAAAAVVRALAARGEWREALAFGRGRLRGEWRAANALVTACVEGHEPMAAFELMRECGAETALTRRTLNALLRALPACQFTPANVVRGFLRSMTDAARGEAYGALLDELVLRYAAHGVRANAATMHALTAAVLAVRVCALWWLCLSLTTPPPPPPCRRSIA